MSGGEFTHLDGQGRARMVDVSAKPATERVAVASGWVQAGPGLLEKLEQSRLPKGDVFAVARVAGIMAAKRVDGLIPLCHPLPLHGVEIDFAIDHPSSRVMITSRVKTVGVTGVEMEALTAVSVSALTIYDMCKSVDKSMVIGGVRLEYKSGGKSGTWTRKD